jgi:Phospholipid methyltransferase
MYVAVGATIVGQALLLGRPLLVADAAASWLVVVMFVRRYEEPTMSARYSEQYAAYRRAVPAWSPRLRPWSTRAAPTLKRRKTATGRSARETRRPTPAGSGQGDVPEHEHLAPAIEHRSSALVEELQ